MFTLPLCVELHNAPRGEIIYYYASSPSDGQAMGCFGLCRLISYVSGTQPPATCINYKDQHLVDYEQFLRKRGPTMSIRKRCTTQDC